MCFQYIAQFFEVYFVFYDNFVSACEARGTTPTTIIKAAGLSTGNITNWKNGVVPKLPALKKLAEALGVSVSALTGDGSTELPTESRETAEQSELAEYLDELRNRSEMRMLFSVAKGASKEDIEAIARFIEAMRET